MTEFWESSFIENQMMWGFEPSDSAILTTNFMTGYFVMPLFTY